MCRFLFSYNQEGHNDQEKYNFLNVDATQDELDGKYGISFLSKFRIMRNDSEDFMMREPEKDDAQKMKLPWSVKDGAETKISSRIHKSKYEEQGW